MPGFPRADRLIGQLDGILPAVVPGKFLTFPFDTDLVTLRDALPDGAIRRRNTEEVVCRIEQVTLGLDRWSITVALAYPPGGRVLESYQASSLVAYNEMLLRSPDGKRTLRPTGSVIEEVSSRRARVRYHFTATSGIQLPPPKELQVLYTAPARLIEMPVRFSFRDLPLP